MRSIRDGWRWIGALLNRILPAGLLRAGSWSLLDQSVISGTNFIVVVAAARALGPADFGVFALLITVLTFMEATQRSLITTPHNVLGVQKSPGDYLAYTSSIGIAQVTLAMIFGGVSVIAGLVALQFDSTLGALILAMAIAAFGWQCQEFTRRVLYTESRVSAAVAGDAVTYLGRLVLALGLMITGTLSAPMLMLLYGFSWLAGAMVGSWNIRKSFTLAFDWSYVRENWAFGRWLFASSTIAHIPRYATTVLLTGALSVSAYGAYRAFEQLANGTNVPLSALSNVLRPRMSRQSKHGPASVWQLMKPIMLVGGAGLLLFAVIFVLLRDSLVGLIYGQEYVAFTAAVLLVALRPFMTLQKSILTKALQAFQNTRSVFIGTSIGAAVGTITGGALILTAGLPAAGAIMILSSLVTSLWFGKTWQRHLANEVQWQDNLKQDPVSARMD